MNLEFEIILTSTETLTRYCDQNLAYKSATYLDASLPVSGMYLIWDSRLTMSEIGMHVEMLKEK